jgi:hypothetical protein
MPTLTRGSSETEMTVTRDEDRIRRSMHGAYARERIEEVIRAVAEDSLIPGRIDAMPWHDESRFEAELREAVREVADVADTLLEARLAGMLGTAPSRLTHRLASARGFSDPS